MVSGIIRPFACCAAFVCLPLLARGESQPDTNRFAVALEYAAASGCPDIGHFESTVSERLGYDAFRKDATDRVLVNIELRGNTIEGSIEWRDVEGKWAGDRIFRSTGSDCQELARAMAFSLALQIQILTTTGAPPASNPALPAEAGKTTEFSPPAPLAPPVSSPPSEKEPKTAAAPTKAAEPAKRGPRPELAVGAGALVGFGMASSPVPLGRLFGTLAWPYASVELGAEVGWPMTTRRADRAGFSQQLLLMSAAGCGTLQPWAACLVAKGGALRVVGKGVDEPASPSSPVLATGLRLAVVFRLWRQAFLAAKAESLVNLVRWKVALDNIPVWTSPRFFQTIGLDVGVRFP
jgi:hypothetical protein